MKYSSSLFVIKKRLFQAHENNIQEKKQNKIMYKNEHFTTVLQSKSCLF